MSKEALRKKIHEMVETIEDEAALNELLEDATFYTHDKQTMQPEDDLTLDQWDMIEQARKQIKNGQFKTYTEVKEHFAQWLTK